MPDHLQLVTHVASSGDQADLDLIVEFTAQAEVADSTRYKYRLHLEEFRVWLNHPQVPRPTEAARKSLVDAQPADVQRFMAYLRSPDRFAASANARKGELSASARKNNLASLRSFYRYLVSVQLVGADPTANVKPPKVRLKPGLRLTVDELRRLLDAPGSPRDRIQTYLLAYTAARSNEIRVLRWRDVDFVERTLMLHGKNDKYRLLDIHPRLMSELRRWFLYQDEEAARNPAVRQSKANPETDFVLMTSSGRPLAASTIAKQLKWRAARAGIMVVEGKGENKSDLTPHALRRTFATLLLNGGHHIDAVADVLGHRSVDTTRNHYAFTSSARRKATIEAFDV